MDRVPRDRLRQAQLIEGLRTRIQAIEGRHKFAAPAAVAAPSFSSGAEDALPSPELAPQSRMASSALPLSPAAWNLGTPTIDASLPHGALSRHGLHEICPATYGDWPAAIAFALRLALRHRASRAKQMARLLWCWPAPVAADLGRPYGPGLHHLGLAPEQIIIVEPARTSEALWAVEEALRSEAPTLVLATLGAIPLTPARRLALAAAETGTPCLLLSPPGLAGTAATATRWRVARQPSAPHPLLASLPSNPRLRLALERCRGASALPDDLSFDVEWCHVTSSFRMVPRMADRAAGADAAGQRAHVVPLRAGHTGPTWPRRQWG